MQYIFIGGPPRCGGTLINSILCSNTKTNPLLRESHYFRELIQLYQRSKSVHSSLEETHYFENEAALKHFSGEIARRFLEIVAKRYHCKEYLVLKSVSLTPLFPVLHEVLPSAKYIIVVRDPRDTISSQLNVGIKQEKLGKHNQFLRDIEKLAKDYMQYYAAAATSNDRSFYSCLLYVKLEDLIHNPIRNIADIGNFTSISLTSGKSVSV